MLLTLSIKYSTQNVSNVFPGTLLLQGHQVEGHWLPRNKWHPRSGIKRCHLYTVSFLAVAPSLWYHLLRKAVRTGKAVYRIAARASLA